MINWKNALGTIVDRVRRAVLPQPKRKTKLADLTPEQKRERHRQQQNESQKRSRAAEKAAREAEKIQQQEQAERERNRRKAGDCITGFDREGRKHARLVLEVDANGKITKYEEIALDVDGNPRKYANGHPIFLKDVPPPPKPASDAPPAAPAPRPLPPMVMPFGLENVPAETDYIFLCPEESGAGEVRVYGFPVIWFDKWDDRFCELPQLQAVKHWFVIFNRAKHADTLGHLRQFITSFASSPWARANCWYDAQSFNFAHANEIQASLKPIYTRLHPHNGSKPLAKSLITLYTPLVALPTDPVEIDKLASLPPRPRGEYVPDFGFGGTGWMPRSDWEPPSGTGSGGNSNDGSGFCY